jgi:hypothetical protein
VDLSLYLLYLHCCLMLPLLLHFWRSGRYDNFLKMLDLLPVLIDFLHNLINLLHRCEICCLRVLWNFLICNHQFLLHLIRVVLFIFVSILACSSTNSNSSRLSLICCNFDVSVHACDCTSCMMLNCSLYKALVGICIITNCIWAKSFRTSSP